MPSDRTALLSPTTPELSSTSGNGTAPTRRIERTPGLPSSRAVVGGLLVAVAAVGTFVAVQQASSGADTTYVVAAHDLDAGQVVSADDVRVEPMLLPDGVSSSSFSDPRLLGGAVVLAPLRSGELIQASSVLLADAAGADDATLDLATPQHEFSFAVARDHALNGTLSRGERIDVVATYGTGDDASTHVVVRSALVVDIDNQTDESIGSTGTITLTLALPAPDDVLRTAHAVEVASVTLVRTTRAASESNGADRYDGPIADTDPGAGPGVDVER